MDGLKHTEDRDGGDKMPSWREVFLYFLFLGFVNIGGPVALGIIAAGIIKLGRASIRNVFLAVLLVAAFVVMRFAGINFLLILLIAGLLNLMVEHGSAVLKRSAPTLPVILVGTSALVPFSDSRLFQIAWLFFKTGLLSFGGAYASLVFVQRGAVAQYHWLSDGQLLDGVAISVATPGPFMLFTTFVGYIAGGIPGAALATFFVFLPSFVFVLAGVHYIEKVRENRGLQAFIAGVSAAVVGVIAVVSLDLLPGALTDWITVAISVAAFLLVAFVKRDVALVAVGAMVGGIIYACVRAFAL